MALRLAESQQLYDGLQDPLLKAALESFFDDARAANMDSLLHAVQQHQRDTMKEARLAGKIEAYSNCLTELWRFAEEQMRSASQ